MLKIMKIIIFIPILMLFIYIWLKKPNIPIGFIGNKELIKYASDRRKWISVFCYVLILISILFFLKDIVNIFIY